MESSELIIAGIGILTTVASGWTSWFFTRKKYNSEVDGTLIENMLKSLEFYELLSDDHTERLNTVLHENDSLRKEIDKIDLENKNLKRELDNLKDQVIKITATICTDLSCLMRNQDFNSLSLHLEEQRKED